MASSLLSSINEIRAKFKLIAGEAFDKKSPVNVYSKIYMIEIKLRFGSELNTGMNFKGNQA